MGNREITIQNMVYDSRKVKDKDLFIAVKGFQRDGHDFLDQALQNGARVLVVEGKDSVVVEQRKNYFNLKSRAINHTMIIVPDTRLAMSLMASAFYGNPSQDLNLIGITGTNGKTTTCYLMASILKQAGERVGWVSTIDYSLGEDSQPRESNYTTPESVDLQRILAQMKENRVSWAVLEVSSHGLALHRTSGCRFNCAVYTNISRDHIDFHQDFSHYIESKARLFELLNESNKNNKTAIINRDDIYADVMIKKFRGANLCFSIKKSADIMASDIECSGEGLRFRVNTPWGGFKVASPLLGYYNVYNILGAIGASLSQGINSEDILKGIEKMRGAPGRFERIKSDAPFDVIVDYAHTDDALSNLLSSARKIAQGNLILVFGCGGNRDRSKRPLMGAVAARLSDFTIVTSDNPRGENIASINKEIIKGYQKVRDISKNSNGTFKVIADRREAIAEAIKIAHPGDMVIVAGKGHEVKQIIGNTAIAFNDRDEVKKILASSKSRNSEF
ncbi:MAG: UDP-N-acetylmuramoyl-L-alanyl-D-glutamate--2,6-diaminopimelate ligase [bacterium]